MQPETRKLFNEWSSQLEKPQLDRIGQVSRPIAQQLVLEEVAWAMYYDMSRCTDRHLRRRRMLRCVELGYVQSVGMVYPADGDGFVQEHRSMREGFTLTDKGKAMLWKEYGNNHPYVMEEWQHAVA